MILGFGALLIRWFHAGHAGSCPPVPHARMCSRSGRITGEDSDQQDRVIPAPSLSLPAPSSHRAGDARAAPRSAPSSGAGPAIIRDQLDRCWG
jgi:hypothetical protein